jgi:hypothetical protein
MGLSGFEYRFVFPEIFEYKTRHIFNFIILPWGRQDHLWLFFPYTVALTAATKAETIIFLLRAVQKNYVHKTMMHSAELRLPAKLHSMEFLNSSKKFSC